MWRHNDLDTNNQSDWYIKLPIDNDILDHRSATGPNSPLVGITQYTAKLPGITQKVGAEASKNCLKNGKFETDFEPFFRLRKKNFFWEAGCRAM